MEETLRLILHELKELKLGQTRLEQGQSKLEQGQTKLEQRQSQLEQRQSQLEQGQTNLEQGQKQLELRQSQLEQGQNQLQQGQQELQKDVSSIKDNLIYGLGPYFESIEKHIDVKADELKGIQEDQQRVIDTLAVRSIRHESEIKDLKHILKNQ